MKQQTSCATETHNKSSKTIDYTGKTIHVGIDVHLKDWQIASVNGTVVLGNHPMEGKVENVVNHLQKKFPNRQNQLSKQNSPQFLNDLMGKNSMFLTSCKFHYQVIVRHHLILSGFE